MSGYLSAHGGFPRGKTMLHSPFFLWHTFAVIDENQPYLCSPLHSRVSKYPAFADAALWLITSWSGVEFFFGVGSAFVSTTASPRLRKLGRV